MNIKTPEAYAEEAQNNGLGFVSKDLLADYARTVQKDLKAELSSVLLDLCYELEKLDASEQQTKVSLVASNLRLQLLP